jgi:hypothetical protein
MRRIGIRSVQRTAELYHREVFAVKLRAAIKIAPSTACAGLEKSCSQVVNLIIFH